MPPAIMTATYMASATEPASRYFMYSASGKLDDFDRDLLRHPAQEGACDLVRLGVPA